MKRLNVSCLLLAVLMMFGQLTVARGDARKSLYERLGGSDGIGKIFDEVGGRMAADPELAKFFQGQSQEALMAQRQRAVEFLCRETGGPCAYSGRPLKQAHGSLGITESQWKAFLKHLARHWITRRSATGIRASSSHWLGVSSQTSSRRTDQKPQCDS